MTGNEYQLFSVQPPLYVIRKVQRKSPKEVIPLSYYYVLHGVVYQAPDLMSVLSARLEVASHHLGECLDTAFSHYKFNQSKGYYWDFNQKEESKKKENESQPRISMFQRERVDPLVHEFFNRFGPKQPEQDVNKPDQTETEQQQQPQQQQQQQQTAEQNKNSDQPAEKKMKMNTK